MRLPEPWQLLFAVKAFVAAMLALYVSFSLSLPNPYWAMTTVFVVSQPFAGAIRSKGLYRLGGTLTGGVVGVALASVFGAFEFPMMLALVAWLSFCAYFSLNDRTPRSYFFLLAGLTALLIGWPGSAVTGSVFDTAVARVLEICLGIVCAVVVDSAFFPRRIGPVIDGQVDKWFEDARLLSLDVLRENNETLTRDRRQLAADASQIALMNVHLTYEGRDSARASRWIAVMQQRMIQLLPALSSIHDRLAEIRRGAAEGEVTLPDGMEHLLADIGDWVEAGMAPERIEPLKKRVETLRPQVRSGAVWQDILTVSLAERLGELLQIVGDCHDLRRQARGDGGVRAPRHLRQLRRDVVVEPHRDRWLAVWSILTALCSFAIAATFWYLTGWPQGSSATLFALLMCLFFGSIDDPVPILKMLIKVLLFAIVLDTLYLFVILPSITSFPTLVIAFAPVLIPLGIVASNPATFMVALMPIALMTLQSSANVSTFEPFINGMAGTFTGVLIVLGVTSVLKSISADISARRLLHAGWRDIASIADRGERTDAAAFTSRMLDRLALLVPRQAAAKDERLGAASALTDLRLGLNLIALRKRRAELAPATRSHVDKVFDAVARHFRRLRKGDDEPSADILALVDEALATASADPDDEHKGIALLTLAGVRRALFPSAPPYRPQTASADRSEAPHPMPVAAE